jgi:peptidoglycan/xylan/chitin deacetylase (PgdA/CDA1 family)
MNAWKARIGDAISAAFSLGGVVPRADGCRILMYHSVGGEVSGDRQRLYSIDPARFESHMRCIAGTMGASVTALAPGLAAARGLAITFDDGYHDNLTVAAPLLADLAIPFTVFVTPDFVRGGDPRYLSPAGVRELAALPGVTIGAHGRSHRRLTECNDAELEHELEESRAWLENLLGRPVTAMSYPHGAVDARVRKAAAAAGYELAFSSRFGAYRQNGDKLCVARTDIWAGDNVARLVAKAAGHWDWMGWLA